MLLDLPTQCVSSTLNGIDYEWNEALDRMDESTVVFVHRNDRTLVVRLHGTKQLIMSDDILQPKNK
jgi:hypothetical protein